MRNVCKNLVCEPKGKLPLQIAGHKLEDNVKTDYKEIGCESLDWFHVTEGNVHWWAVLNMALLLCVP
jgi:hypothetical protein